MTSRYSKRPFTAREKAELKKKIHRALVEARNAQYRGEHGEARSIVQRAMAEAAPAAYRAGLGGGHNWVVEELKPLDDLLLPDDS